MKPHEKIKIIYGLLGLNAKTFAESINFKGQTVSRMVQVEGKPSYEFLESMFKKYPEISKDWLFHEVGKPITTLSEKEIEDFKRVNEPFQFYGDDSENEKHNEVIRRIETLERQVRFLEIAVLSSSK
jgi:hypothetical protein